MERLFAYAMVLALVGGAGYLAYNIYFPPARKPRRSANTAPTDAPAAPADPDEWIPVHHKRAKKTSGGGATSGEESEATEGYASEKSASGAKKRGKGGRK